MTRFKIKKDYGVQPKVSSGHKYLVVQRFNCSKCHRLLELYGLVNYCYYHKGVGSQIFVFMSGQHYFTHGLKV